MNMGTVWGPVFCGDQDRIERVQRRATKMVPAIRHLPYQERLERLNLPSLYYRRIRGDMVIVYQLLTGKIRVDHSKFFTLSPASSTTRGNSKKQRKDCFSTNERRNFFSARIVNNWNKLTKTAVSAKNLNKFKTELERRNVLGNKYSYKNW